MPGSGFGHGGGSDDSAPGTNIVPDGRVDAAGSGERWVFWLLALGGARAWAMGATGLVLGMGVATRVVRSPPARAQPGSLRRLSLT